MTALVHQHAVGEPNQLIDVPFLLTHWLACDVRKFETALKIDNHTDNDDHASPSEEQ